VGLLRVFIASKNRGNVFIYTLNKTPPPPIFHWVQTASTKYRDRSHWWVYINSQRKALGVMCAETARLTAAVFKVKMQTEEAVMADTVYIIILIWSIFGIIIRLNINRRPTLFGVLFRPNRIRIE